MTKPDWWQTYLKEDTERYVRLQAAVEFIGKTMDERGAKTEAFEYLLRTHEVTKDAWPVKKDG